MRRLVKLRSGRKYVSGFKSKSKKGGLSKTDAKRLLKQRVKSIFAFGRKAGGKKLRQAWALGYAKMKFLKKVH